LASAVDWNTACRAGGGEGCSVMPGAGSLAVPCTAHFLVSVVVSQLRADSTD